MKTLPVDDQNPDATSQVTLPGYDNMTGVGTPSGSAFIHHLRQLAGRAPRAGPPAPPGRPARRCPIAGPMISTVDVDDVRAPDAGPRALDRVWPNSLRS